MFAHAIVREPGENFSQGITTSNLGVPSFERMKVQHQQYIDTLRSLGLEVLVLAAELDFPDAHFVEDTAVVMPELAVITNPGAEARKGEEDSIESVLSHYRQTARIQAPGTMDGGDVLLVNSHFFIGLSERTNQDGIEQFGRMVQPYGYSWTAIPVAAGLHFKSSVNYVGKNTLLVTPEFAHLEAFDGYEKLLLDPAESYAANTLLVNDTLIMPKGFPDTREKLAGLGLTIVELDVSEVRKMDGGLTCLSLRF